MFVALVLTLHCDVSMNTTSKLYSGLSGINRIKNKKLSYYKQIVKNALFDALNYFVMI